MVVDPVAQIVESGRHEAGQKIGPRIHALRRFIQSQKLLVATGDLLLGFHNAGQESGKVQFVDIGFLGHPSVGRLHHQRALAAAQIGAFDFQKDLILSVLAGKQKVVVKRGRGGGRSLLLGHSE